MVMVLGLYALTIGVLAVLLVFAPLDDVDVDESQERAE